MSLSFMFKLVVNYFHSIEKLDEKRVYCLWFMYVTSITNICFFVLLLSSMYRVVYVHDKYGHDDEGDRLVIGPPSEWAEPTKLDKEVDGDTNKKYSSW